MCNCAHLHLHLQIGLVGADGIDLPIHIKAGSSSRSKSKGSKAGSSSDQASDIAPEGVVHEAALHGSVSTSVVLLVNSWHQTYTFTQLSDKPCVSLLRDFSAPVRLQVEGETDKSLGFLAVHDGNPFARYVVAGARAEHKELQMSLLSALQMGEDADVPSNS